jgi:hypothetical protein
VENHEVILYLKESSSEDEVAMRIKQDIMKSDTLRREETQRQIEHKIQDEKFKVETNFS